MNDNTSNVTTTNNESKFQPQNRAQRRAMAKLQKKQNKMIMNYIKKHPEAIKVELDEKKIEELEKEEANLTISETNEKTVVTSEDMKVGEVESINNDRGHRVKMNPVDEACDSDGWGFRKPDRSFLAFVNLQRLRVPRRNMM